jgi:hypothetical protein
VRHARRADPLHLLRGNLAALAALGVVGTAFELATLRHWNGAMQLVPWAALAMLAVALALHVRPVGRPPRTRLVRALALLVLATSFFGVLEHALVNYHAGPLDQRFADTWDALSPWLRWWYAVTRTVGPAPTLAPGMLGQAAATLMLATIGQRATSATASIRRHRRHPYLSGLSDMTCARADATAATTTIASPRRLSGYPPTRHRRPRW